jgi:PAS domain-containing protein
VAGHNDKQQEFYMPLDFADILGRTTLRLGQLEDVVSQTTTRTRAQLALKDLRDNVERLTLMHAELVQLRQRLQAASTDAARRHARFLALLDFVKEPVLLVAGTGLEIQHANVAAAAFLNLSVSSLAGRHLLSFVAADRPGVQATLDNAATWPAHLATTMRPRERRAVSVTLRLDRCEEPDWFLCHIAPQQH